MASQLNSPSYKLPVPYPKRIGCNLAKVSALTDHKSKKLLSLVDKRPNSKSPLPIQCRVYSITSLYMRMGKQDIQGYTRYIVLLG